MRRYARLLCALALIALLLTGCSSQLTEDLPAATEIPIPEGDYVQIQVDGVTEVRPNRATDPQFADAMEEAERQGVRMLFLPCHVETDSIVAAGKDLSLAEPERRPQGKAPAGIRK